MRDFGSERDRWDRAERFGSLPDRRPIMLVTTAHDVRTSIDILTTLGVDRAG